MLMVLHVMLAGHARLGLCGATVAGLYFSKVPGEGGRRLHLCPVCRSLALKVAPTGYEIAGSVGATQT